MSSPPVVLASVDSAWLRMDEPANRMVVTGVLILDEPVPLARLREVIETRLLAFPRFRQRVVDGGPVGAPAWSVDDNFDLDCHLRAVELAQDDEASLEALVSRLMSEPLDASRPLWQFHFVPHYQGGSAVVCRVHHCIGDGLALIYVMLSMDDASPAATDPETTSAGNGGSALASVTSTVRSMVSAGLALPGTLIREVGQIVTNPARIGALAGGVTSSVGALGKLLLMDPDPATSLKGPLVVEKRVAWSRPIAVAEVKRIGKATGATVNDVLVSAVAGALRRYVLAHGDRLTPTEDVRAVLPVNLRPIEEAHRLGNQFGLVFLALPIGVPEPLDRLFEVRTRMNAIKRSPEAYLTFQILRAIGTAPRQVFDLIVSLFERKATAVMTNVIGPRDPIRIAGARMRQAMFWVPCAGRLGIGISVLSYAGQVWMGVATDARVVPDPHDVLRGFYEEIDALADLLVPLQDAAVAAGGADGRDAPGI